MPRNGEDLHRSLQHAAMELFRERGYGQTTATEIAARAGVTERTFFRHFADKREVLFGRSDAVRAMLVEKILQAPDVLKPLQLVIAVLAEFDWESLGSRAFHRQRQALIATSPELLERDLIKHKSLTIEFTKALRQRGVNADIAQLASRVGTQIFDAAYGNWLKAGGKGNLSTICETMMSLLATIAPNSTRLT